MINEPRIVPIPRSILPEMWRHAAPHLLKGLTKATDVTIAQVVDDLIAGTDRLWCVIDDGKVIAAFVTATHEDQDTAEIYLCVYALGGVGLDRWGKALGEQMIEAARLAGCASVRFTGRDAWSRVLPTYAITGRRGNEATFERAAL